MRIWVSSYFPIDLQYISSTLNLSWVEVDLHQVLLLNRKIFVCTKDRFFRFFGKQDQEDLILSPSVVIHIRWFDLMCITTDGDTHHLFLLKNYLIISANLIVSADFIWSDQLIRSSKKCLLFKNISFRSARSADQQIIRIQSADQVDR